MNTDTQGNNSLRTALSRVLLWLIVLLLAGAVPRQASAGGAECFGPNSGCRSPGKSLLLIRDQGDDTNDKLTWKWLKGEDTPVATFGDPTVDQAYALCVYDNTGPRFARFVPAGSGWAAAGSQGFTFTGDGVGDDGITKIKLKAGSAGKAKVLVKGRGADLGIGDTPASSLPLVLPVTVEVHNFNGDCWSATYSGATENSAALFKSHQLAPSPTPTATSVPTSTATVTATPTLAPKHVFAFFGGVAGDFGGLAVADSYCQSDANVAFLGGTYKAWLSESGSPAASRLTHWAGRYERVDGTKVADDWADLTDGTLDAPINTNAVGGAMANNFVWTGTLGTGLSSSVDCSGWNSNAGTGQIGDINFTNANWTQFGALSCSANLAGFYCIEQ